MLDFWIFVVHNERANPKDCHLNQTCVRYAQGASSVEFSTLVLVFFVGKNSF